MTFELTLEKSKLSKSNLWGILTEHKTFNLTYWSIKSDDLYVDLQNSIRVPPFEKNESKVKVVRFGRSIRQIEGLAKTKYPMNLILITLIFSRSIPRSKGTPIYNSSIRKFFADYSINSLSIFKKKTWYTYMKFALEKFLFFV